MIRREIVIDDWNASYFDNIYDGNKRKGTANRKKQISIDIFMDKIKDTQKSTSLSNTMLPPNCRYSLDTGTYKLFIMLP